MPAGARLRVWVPHNLWCQLLDPQWDLSVSCLTGWGIPASLHVCSEKTQLLWVTTVNEVTEGHSAGSWSGTAHVPHSSFRGASVCVIHRLGWVWCDCVILQQTSGWSSQQSWGPGFRQGFRLLGGSLQVFRSPENLFVFVTLESALCMPSCVWVWVCAWAM